MSVVNGFRAQRLSRGLTRQKLSDLSGLSLYLIRRCEEGQTERTTLANLLTLSNTLGITIKEGCRLREIRGDRHLPLRHEPRNLLEAYMAHWDLTLEGLAVILDVDVSVQTASIQCSKPIPAPKYIRRLAEEENMTVPQFEAMYRALQYA